ncbi:hypothetical protein N0V83_002648 [Neocucurbitaria cava]|uniref:Uncharacterized protein n=1 Tax=Neocucurbitaria cava TaxID=798079 RepID=A0A9W9CPU3_9PLEO|nr:hypothetical protein N0V83_002648 [Neocucurbitaria cava]
MANEQDYINGPVALEAGSQRNISNTSLPATTTEEEVVADVDEPPEPARTPRPAPLKLHSSTTSFTKSTPILDRKESLLTSALKSNSNASSPVDEKSEQSPLRGMSCVSTWSNTSGTTAELTSDGGFTSPGTRTSTPSPPLPSAMFNRMMPTFNQKPLELPISIVSHDDENIDPLQKPTTSTNDEQKVEAVLGRKRCIMFACGKKEEKNPAVAAAKPTPPQAEAPPKRACTIKFACPTKTSTDTVPRSTKIRSRLVSPAPSARRIPSSPKPSSKVHRDSDSTICNNSPISVRKVAVVDRTRRLSANSDLARCEKYRFHEFASSEEEVEEWTQEVTCHRNRLTVQDTLKVENNLRQLGEEVEEEEALDEEEEEEDAADMDDDDDLLDEDDNDSDAYSDATDEGFQTDDEEGFAVSDDESDAGSDYNWWAPGASTAATSVEHIEQLRLKPHRTVSESSIGSLESREGLKISDKPPKRVKTRPVNIRIPSPELPDSTDFVCGTLDEDRPAEEEYMSTLKRRRAAKQKKTPQDIDPTFPTSDPELPDDEEDEVSEDEHVASESDFMMHGRMDLVDGNLRGRRTDGQKKRSPAPSPKRLRSPPPAKRAVHRSPPPRKLFGNSPKRLHSPPPPMRLRSPPPTRRGSVNPLAARQRSEMSIRFGGIGERPALMVSASVPRTPIAMMNPFDLEEEEVDPDEMPVRRAIDIQVGLERKRQRRKEQLYRKQHRKGVKEKRPAPGKGAERMREMGLAAHAHKGKTTAFGPFQIPANTDQKDMHVLSV